MARLNPYTPSELVLEISATAEGPLEVYPRGLRRDEGPFLIDAVLSAPDAPSVESLESAALGKTYYQRLFAERPVLTEWLDARIDAGGGRLIFSMTPETFLEQWETLATPNGKLVVQQRITIERRLTGIGPGARGGGQPAAALRALWVSPQQPSGEDSGARRMQRLFDEGMVTCQPATLQDMLQTLATARDEGRPFQVVHLEGQGFYEYPRANSQRELWFQNPHGGGIVVEMERLGEVFSGLPLLILEDYPRVSSRELRHEWPAVVPQLLGLGVQSIIVVPFPKGTGHAARFVDRLYDELGKGETVGQAVSDGRRALLIEPAPQAAAAEPPAPQVDRLTVQLYQQGDDIALVRSLTGAPSPRQSSYPARSSTSGKPEQRASASVVPSPSLRFFLPYIALGLVLALAGGAWMLRNHIRAANQRKAQATEQRRVETELAAKHRRLEEEAKGCLNPNAFRCAEVLPVAEECRRTRRASFWPMCSYLVGRIKEDGLHGEADPAGALEAYEEGCGAGYGLACLNLGHMEHYGRGLPRPNLGKARQDYEHGCDVGNLEACANAGWLYADPTSGLKQDLVRAREFYQKSSKGNGGNGLPRGNVGLGNLHFQDGDSPGAYRLFSSACSQGDPLGCKRQGDLTDNPAEQQSLYEKACRFLDNHPGACSGCVVLAKNYERQAGKEQAAFAIYERLCPSDHEKENGLSRPCREDKKTRAKACRWLGWSKDHGELMQPVNKEAARKAYRQGCDLQDQPSCEELNSFNASSH